MTNATNPTPAPKTPKLGDILVMSWGYDQTNIDFYQVIAVTKASVRLRKIEGKRIDGRALVAAPGVWADARHRNADQDPEYFEKGALKRFRLDKAGYSVSMTSYSNAYLWDGEPEFDTYAHGGAGH